jgi:hypothetical protein
MVADVCLSSHCLEAADAANDTPQIMQLSTSTEHPGQKAKLA